jgi:hypothetical protein
LGSADRHQRGRHCGIADDVRTSDTLFPEWCAGGNVEQWDYEGGHCKYRPDNSADSAAVGVFLRNSLGGAHIQISSGNFSLLQTDENGVTEEAWISGNKNGGVTLNHNGSPSIGTIGTGVNIIGTEINLSGKPTITGSRGGNTALTDLLTSLAAIGLITDSSTN